MANHLDLEINTQEKVQFLAADGQTSTTLGQTKIRFSPEFSVNDRLEMKPHVCQDLPTDLLVGMETLCSASLNFTTKTLTLKHKEKNLVIPIIKRKTTFSTYLSPEICFECPPEIDHWLDKRSYHSQSHFAHIDFWTFLADLKSSDPDPGMGENAIPPISNDIISKIKIGNSLTENQRSIVENLIRDFSDVFQVGSEISLFKGGNHKMMRIPLTTKRYSRDLKVPTIPTALYEPWSKQLSIWIENKIVEKQYNQVPYLGGFVPVKKRDGSYRFAYDARNINAIVEDEHISLPRTDTLASNLAGRKFYCSLDICSFYQNFLVHPDSRDLLSFYDPVTCTMYRFTRSVFGLKGSCQTSVNLMNEELAKIPGYNEFIIGYVDDINISTDTFDHMVDLLTNLFEVLRSCSIKLKLSKCSFFDTQMDIFGFNISQNGMTISQKRSEAIQNTPLPKSKKQLVSHLASINYFRSLCPSDGSMAKFQAGFSDITKNSAKFVFTEKHSRLWNEMHQMIGKMISRQRLLPSDRKVVLRVDSSESFFGYCLSASRDKGEVIILTGSKMWADTSRAWHITRKELVACLEAIKTLEWALINRHVTIVTDNSWCFFALKFPNRISLFEPSLISRKLVSLSLIDYEVVKATNDSKGFKLTDALSRSDTHFLITKRNSEQLLTEYQKNRDEYPTLMCDFLPKKFDFCNLAINTSMRDAKSFQDLIITIQASESFQTKGHVPERFRLALVLRCHSLGHLGSARIQHIFSRFGLSWPKKEILIKQVLSQCECSKFKPLTRPILTRDGTVEANRPFDIIEIDCNSIGQFNPIHLLVAVCPFSKFLMVEKIGGNLTSKNILLKLFTIIARYCPQVQIIRLDNAQYFKSDSFQNPLKEANIKISFASRHGSRSMANVERANRKLNEQLRFRELDSLSSQDFEIVLQSLVTSINCAPSPDTPFSPFELIYGLSHSPFDENFNHAVSMPKDLLIKGIRDVQQLRGLFLNSPNEDLNLYHIGDIVRIRSNPKLGSNKIFNLKFTAKLYIILDVNLNRGTYKLCALEDRNRSNPAVLYSHHRFVKLFKSKNEPTLPSLKDIESSTHHLIGSESPKLDSESPRLDSELGPSDQRVPTPGPIIDPGNSNTNVFSGTNAQPEAENTEPPRRSTRVRKKPKRFGHND